MTFFTKSDGSAVEPQTSASSGGFQKLIPEGTQLHCAIAGAVWAPATQNANEHIVVTLHVTEPGPYRNFTVDHKLHVLDDSDKKRDKALDMLMTYDTLCRGALLKADKEGKAIEKNNGLLARALNGGNVLATFAVWEMEREGKEAMTGNWVREITASKSAKAEKKEADALDKKAESEGIEKPDDFDDDIPF